MRTEEVLPFFKEYSIPYILSIINSYNNKNITETSNFKRITQLRNLLSIAEVCSNPQYVRVGKAFDGGYIMYDDFSSVDVAYSFGINDDVSWDLDIAKRGINIYMYDHTINCLPMKNDHFHYFKIGICGNKTKKDDLKTLPELLRINGHENKLNMILKIDVEGAEWEFLSELPSDILKHFKQIILELHNLNNTKIENNIVNGLTNLNKTHQAVHIHGNNNSSGFFIGGLVMPNSLEVTYLNREIYDFTYSDKVFPTELDQPNNPAWPDIILGEWVRQTFKK